MWSNFLKICEENLHEHIQTDELIIISQLLSSQPHNFLRLICPI